jgi:hypothetical protein
MRKLIVGLFLVILVSGCLSSKKIVYDFESQNLSDSVSSYLYKYAKTWTASKTGLFALLREKNGEYELFINERPADKASLFSVLIEKTNRVIKLKESIAIPVLFDADILSGETRKVNAGSLNIGGYYFRVKKIDGVYQVIEKSLLF